MSLAREHRPWSCPLPPGTLVRLHYCLHGEPGRVLGTSRGMVLVEWRDLDFTGKHPQGAL